MMQIVHVGLIKDASPHLWTWNAFMEKGYGACVASAIYTILTTLAIAQGFFFVYLQGHTCHP